MCTNSSITVSGIMWIPDNEAFMIGYLILSQATNQLSPEIKIYFLNVIVLKDAKD